MWHGAIGLPRGRVPALSPGLPSIRWRGGLCWLGGPIKVAARAAGVVFFSFSFPGVPRGDQWVRLGGAFRGLLDFLNYKTPLDENGRIDHVGHSSRLSDSWLFVSSPPNFMRGEGGGLCPCLSWYGFTPRPTVLTLFAWVGRRCHSSGGATRSGPDRGRAGRIGKGR